MNINPSSLSSLAPEFPYRQQSSSDDCVLLEESSSKGEDRDEDRNECSLEESSTMSENSSSVKRKNVNHELSQNPLPTHNDSKPPAKAQAGKPKKVRRNSSTNLASVRHGRTMYTYPKIINEVKNSKQCKPCFEKASRAVREVQIFTTPLKDSDIPRCDFLLCALDEIDCTKKGKQPTKRAQGPHFYIQAAPGLNVSQLGAIFQGMANDIEAGKQEGTNWKIFYNGFDFLNTVLPDRSWPGHMRSLYNHKEDKGFRPTTKHYGKGYMYHKDVGNLDENRKEWYTGRTSVLKEGDPDYLFQEI